MGREDGVAGDAALAQVGEHGARALPAGDDAELGVQRAAGHEAHERLEVARRRAVLVVEVAQGRAGLVEVVEEVELRRRPARLAEPEHEAAGRDLPQRARERRPADRLEHDVERAVARRRRPPRRASAPSESSRCGRRETTVTEAPAPAASSTRKCPTPPDAPVTSSRRPAGDGIARSNRSAVRPASGSAAAISGARSPTGASASVRTATRSAQPPPGGCPTTPLADSRSGPVGRRAHDHTGDVLAGAPAAALEQEQLAAVERERLDRHDRLVRGRDRLIRVLERDEIRAAGGEESKHATTVRAGRREGKDRPGMTSDPSELERDRERGGGERAVGEQVHVERRLGRERAPRERRRMRAEMPVIVTARPSATGVCARSNVTRRSSSRGVKSEQREQRVVVARVLGARVDQDQLVAQVAETSIASRAASGWSGCSRTPCGSRRSTSPEGAQRTMPASSEPSATPARIAGVASTCVSTTSSGSRPASAASSFGAVSYPELAP